MTAQQLLRTSTRNKELFEMGKGEWITIEAAEKVVDDLLKEKEELKNKLVIQKLKTVHFKNALTEIRTNELLWRIPKIGGQDQYAGMPPLARFIDDTLNNLNEQSQ